MPNEKPPDLYLKLIHGRNSPTEQLDDWGFQGPTLGPFHWIHSTYATHVRCGWDANGDEICLDYSGDLLTHEGKYYGDWEVTTKEDARSQETVIKEKPSTNRWAYFSTEELAHLKVAAAEVITSQLASDLDYEVEAELKARGREEKIKELQAKQPGLDLSHFVDRDGPVLRVPNQYVAQVKEILKGIPANQFNLSDAAKELIYSLLDSRADQLDQASGDYPNDPEQTQAIKDEKALVDQLLEYFK